MNPLHTLGRTIVCSLSLLALGIGATHAEDAYVEGEVLVTFKPEVGTEGAKTALKRRELSLERKFDRLSQRRQRIAGLVRGKKRGTKELIAELKTDPSVETAEPNYIRHVSSAGSSDPEFSKLWGLHNTGQSVNGTAGSSGTDAKFVEAWALAKPSAGEVVVAVVDTGVDITHPDLAANIWTNPGEIAGNAVDDDGNGQVDDVHGYDFSLNTANMSDSGEHGTHVAGTIAATGDNNLGVIGVNYKAKILPLKVSTDGDTLSTSAVLAAFDYAIELKERGVNVVAINASFGGGSSSTSESNAIEALRDAGIVLCAAAGNDGENNDTVASYPANYPVSNIIAVAATTQTNGLASFSNYGASNVDIGAPGTNIYSAMPTSLAPQTTSLKIGSTTYAAASIEFAGSTTSSGLTRPIYACGIGQVNEFPAGVSGNIALIQRGTLTFAEKLTNAKAAGAVAAVIYDNTTSAITTNPWTLGATGSWIPAVRISQANGQTIAESALPVSATVTAWANTSAAYQYMDGTSMATPHVAGAVAFAAMNFPGETMTQRISRILNHTTQVAALSGKVSTGGVLNLLKIVDTDVDNLPDWWESEEFTNLAQASAMDTDGDGFSNQDEYQAGTDPADATSKLGFSATSRGSGTAANDFILTLPTVPGRSYRVEWSTSLTAESWATLGSIIAGTGNPVEVRDTAAFSGAAKRFYRLSLVTP
ncbi:S8 family serine peptidase [Luteolibacter luteus]|uniref:S8 family serine peptidase n=1 Tax=Luteolibacter luteus TaxID=2728835 RepID=A0A858REM4_9BACT|nr:S8 family serine peptidase [Luteolibacter luteus]QJE95546.1 S8 family serine peptidase [Luteolibacter luteus]